MEVQLTPEHEEFIRRAIEAGRFATPDEAMREAVSLLAEHEREIADLRAKADEGIADLDSGKFTDYTDKALPRMIEDIRRDGREFQASIRKRG